MIRRIVLHQMHDTPFPFKQDLSNSDQHSFSRFRGASFGGTCLGGCGRFGLIRLLQIHQHLLLLLQVQLLLTDLLLLEHDLLLLDSLLNARRKVQFLVADTRF